MSSLGPSAGALLCSLLWNKRTRSEQTRATSVIKTLIGYTLTTGLLTSFTSLIGLILALTFRRTMIYVALINSLGNIYTNALLASLNRRDRIRSVMDPTMEMISARSQPGTGAKPKEIGTIVFAPSEDTYGNQSVLSKTGEV
ncbi:hypothetical protein JR316_0007544 [Psilocybe cubensis]|uniref:Uncharacterized protein n=2 Tax=Psilocybe cubensis TaxID=181762 RepID=A0ACB8GZS2_PSICU|nr:hypothetical protein JR316_0007544 [Psilocybe cubensis]KAH9480937.1 hypothetical protein JR316_0007544 [Psilocybe cubensis]